jgi:hypothetical protein
MLASQTTAKISDVRILFGVKAASYRLGRHVFALLGIMEFSDRFFAPQA